MDKMLDNVNKMIEKKNFVSLSDDLTDSIHGLFKKADQKLMTFGTRFLDQAMRGLANDEVVLLGAPSGIGKTEYCIRLALENVKRGFTVHMFSLEASKNEIALRYMYMRVADMYYKDPNKKILPTGNFNLNYLDFYYGRYKSTLDDYMNVVLKEDLSNLKIYYKSDDFGIHEFLRAVDGITKKTDLIIVDHIHYFDMQTENENREMKEIIKKIRFRSQILNKPIVLVAHLRKKDTRVKRLVADLDDFHGSSDIGKIATTAIVLGAGESVGNGKYETYFRIVKHRKDGSLKYYTFKTHYNKFLNAYDDEYEIGKEKYMTDPDNPRNKMIGFEAFTSVPYWADKPKIKVIESYNMPSKYNGYK